MKISIVTSNRGKFDEIGRMLEARGHRADNLMVEYPELQADSLEAVVLHGLSWLMERHERCMLIDDSGLFIDILGGFPGVYSAYVYKSIGCDGILKLMVGLDDRNARFECCLGFVEPGEEPRAFKGVSEGVISHAKRGDEGFGFDPIFIPDGHERTFAEMDTDLKNRLSHRGRAIEKLLEYLDSRKADGGQQ